MSDFTMKVRLGELSQFASIVEQFAIEAGRDMVRVVQQNVIDLTPRDKGTLQSNVFTREEQGGRVQVVYLEGVVGRVMEGNPAAVWKKPPPWKAILQWVERKLGLSGKDARRAAAGIRRKIFLFGMQLPLKYDQRGQMFARTEEKMRATQFHRTVFISAMRRRAAAMGRGG